MASLLSAREQEVLLCLERGATVAVAARQLRLSENTVKTHLRRIYDKLNVHSQRDALAVARLTGLLPQEGRRPSLPSDAAAGTVPADGQASPPP